MKFVLPVKHDFSRLYVNTKAEYMVACRYGISLVVVRSKKQDKNWKRNSIFTALMYYSPFIKPCVCVCQSLGLWQITQTDILKNRQSETACGYWYSANNFCHDKLIFSSWALYNFYSRIVDCYIFMICHIYTPSDGVLNISARQNKFLLISQKVRGLEFQSTTA